MRATRAKPALPPGTKLAGRPRACTVDPETGLSSRQQDLIREIATQAAATGATTQTALAQALGVRRRAIECMLHRIGAKGLAQWDGGIGGRRVPSVRLTKTGAEVASTLLEGRS